MAIKAFRLNSPLVAFGARVRIHLTTWLTVISEEPTRLAKWLAVVAAVSLCFPHALAFAGAEERCNGLGSACVCAESLDTNTHDGGNTIWATPSPFNPDDSTTKQCYPFAADPTVELYCGSAQFGPVAASTQSGFLPSGNRLSFVNRQSGAGICHVMHPTIVEAPDMTYCIRAYSRWEVGSAMPSTDPNAQQQQKILTIAGNIRGTVDYLNAQISFGEGPPNLHTRFDGNAFDAPVDFQSLGSVVNDCENAFCRFEICFDYSSIGEGRVRLRRTTIAPGAGQSTVFKPLGNTRRPNGIALDGAAGSGLAMFAQSYSPIRYNTHFIVTRVRPEDRNFWPGAACEVEGGCTGAQPAPQPTPQTTPMAPAGLIAR